MMRKIATGGFGDPLNHYAHSGAWFKGRLLVGTSRANLQFLKLGQLDVDIPQWPVNHLGENYSVDFEEKVAPAEIWSLAVSDGCFDAVRLYQSPYHPSVSSSAPFRSEISYRSMCVVQDSGVDSGLFVATTSRSKGDGPDLLLSRDGFTFTRLPKPRVGSIDISFPTQPRFTSIRNLIQFDDLLITCVTGGSKGNINHSLNSHIYASASPESGDWISINGDGFGCYPDCFCVFSLCVHQGCLYAGTGGINGFALYRGRRTGSFSFEWELVVDRGAGRGSLNQGIVAMSSFGGHLYFGTGIQSGGFDRVHNVGPGAFEVFRLSSCGKIELLVGESRDGYSALSGHSPGFSNPFNAYCWKMHVHANQLYIGTLDTSVFSLFTSNERLACFAADQLCRSDLLGWLLSSGGADLWRSKDGCLWEPVSTNGLDNFFNYGIRTLVSSGKHLFAGTANPFGPKIWNSETMQYEPNLLCGAEIVMIDN